MKLYNTLTRSLEEVIPTENGFVTVYNCGPTVYMRMHIGNLRAYVFCDVLYRSLIYSGFKVKRITNLTDVGHMVGDEDHGEDKVETSAKKEGKDPFQIADEYIRTVMHDFYRMNILSPNGEKIDPEIDLTKLKDQGWTRATVYVDQMIELVKKMEEEGFTYETDQAVYFDVSKFPDYWKLSGQKLEEKKVGARDDVNIDPGKKNPADFVLWMKRIGRYEDHAMHWSSPWGDGFPGWHIECSAMGISELGEDITIHTGGIDHIPVHHSNEIAQNYGSTGKQVVKMWVHNEFLNTKSGEKLAKSEGNSWYLDDIVKKGFDPMDLRYLFVSVNYKVPLQYSDEALKGARNSRFSIISKLRDLYSGEKGEVLGEYKEEFVQAIGSNLNMSEALAIIAKLLKSTEKPEDVVTTVLDFDRVLGLDLENELKGTDKLPKEIQDLVDQRQRAREEKDFASSDVLRAKIESQGYEVLDTPEGQKVKKTN